MQFNKSDFLKSNNSTKKHSLKERFNKWCALLCAYRTENYDDYKQLDYRTKLVLVAENINKDVFNLLVI